MCPGRSSSPPEIHNLCASRTRASTLPRALALLSDQRLPTPLHRKEVGADTVLTHQTELGHVSRFPATKDTLTLTPRATEKQQVCSGGRWAPPGDLLGGRVPCLSAVCCWTPGVTVCRRSAPRDGLPAQKTSSCSSARWSQCGATCRCPHSECPGCAAQSG